MIGKRYRITINDDPTLVHGWMSREIEEVFVPELDLYINAEAVFVDDGGNRVPGKWVEVEVDTSGCMALRDALLASEQLKKRVQKDLFGEGD